MAPQKRKQPHDEPTAESSSAAPRRTTRHSAGAAPLAGAEPEKQRRSGRIRANTLENPQNTITRYFLPKSQTGDAPKLESAEQTQPPSETAATPPTPAPAPKATRRAGGQPAEPEAEPGVESSIAVRTKPSVEKKRSKPAASTTQAAVPPTVAPASPNVAKAEPKIQANTSRPRTYVSQSRSSPQSRPQATHANNYPDPATVSSLTPRRRASATTIPKPPPTPRADRNIDKVALGDICFKTWYPSYYSKEVLGDTSGNPGLREQGNGAKIGGGKKEKEAVLDRLLAYVPGTKVYTHPKQTARSKRPARNDGLATDKGDWSVWEVDGERDALFCQNLSLFAKLFLDNKSVFFDVTGFTYFLLTYTPPPEPSGQIPAPRICGFFSKEKMSWDNNNLACILVFPPWQRKGLGALLMGISYEISKREGIIGGPEKPISELGRKGYKRYWAGEITRWLLGLEVAKGRTNEELLVDLEDCSRETWIALEDCLAILREMNLIEEGGIGPPKPRPAGQEDECDEEAKEQEASEVPRVKIDKVAVRQWVEDNKIDLERVCDPDGFVEGYAIKELEAEDEE
ncbi:hypothetical protein G7054_g4796 [Neopestalotiopsis clavispora]|nr:hypothetical protein G7054_g4796 [Neopestalotiopsis clavispora]